MTPIEFMSLALLIVIAGQTSYMLYTSRRTNSHHKGAQVFVDTSVLMDGRILPIAEVGFVPGILVIPRSVIGELQLLADGGDNDKRERARRGLDVISELQALDTVNVRILQDGSRAEEGVDERLLSLAKRHAGILCTIDFNLNKVAQVEGIRVLNINELAQKLRMSYLPGDKLRLILTQPGSDSHQAIGHLEDGTMVVVEHAKGRIGKTVEVEIIRSLQTAAGRMMFAKLTGGDASQSNANKNNNDARGRKKTPMAGETSAKANPVKPRSERPTQKPRHQAGPTNQPLAARKNREDALIELVNKQR